MNKDYKWSLRKGGKKERCPQCGKMRFVPFVLTADPTVKAGPEYGRCDREQSCGYFCYPGSEVKIDTDREYTPEPPKEPILMPGELAWRDCVTARNTLLRAYAEIIKEGILLGTMNLYHCGTGSHGECIYYQFDGDHVRTAKAILYGKDGHRIKTEDGGLPVWWLHKSPTVAKYTAGKELRQCFFGQHLLKQYPTVKVYVVEAEKTAVLMSATDCKLMNDRIWLACGGSQMLKGAIDLMPLVGRDVTLVPDDGQYWNWRRTAEAYGWRCLDIEPLKKYHRLPNGCDIWDCREAQLKGGTE
ncbi:MAG: hypothetical protein J6T33_01660 [Bacteroidales bacterium]|nr:hypothetical protein [Bacteroidales bacterium]